MVSIPVPCPHCQSIEVIKAGKQANGVQRYQCQNGQCERRIFLLHYQHRARVPEVRRSIPFRVCSKDSGKSFAKNLVFTAIMPQPISTPTAAGMTAPCVAMTDPTVAPLPK